MVSAAYYLEQAVSNRKDELENMPIDEEVKVLNDQLVYAQRAYEEVTKWHKVPAWAKFTLYVSLWCIVISCYLVQLLSTQCFAKFELAYSIDEQLDGDWKNLVLPLGSVSIILFIASWAFLYIFISWATGKANSLLKLENQA